MLYDDAEQLEVRYVISLAHHDVSIHGLDEQIPEGELWIKRNAICLTRKAFVPESQAPKASTAPFYLFSDNLSIKEDFYFAIVNNLDKIPDDPDAPPTPEHFHINHMVNLVRRLHSSEEHLQTRWINAFIGRLFLALYKTEQLEDFLWNKISKKISRVKKPNFITQVALQKVDAGEGAPFLTNPRLKDLTIEGDCCIEADLDYSGNFRMQVAATARIDLGSRFKPRDVDLVLAVVLKKLKGHVLFRVKPPPSNRAWISFETMPVMDMALEPIVSSRQITYGIILRAIESRIREVVAETLVQPFWDDMPFFDTASQPYRGGIWHRKAQRSRSTIIPDETGEPLPPAGRISVAENPGQKPGDESLPPTVPSSSDLYSPGLSRGEDSNTLHSDASSVSSGADKTGRPEPAMSIRARSFSSVADPVLTAPAINSNQSPISAKQLDRDATSQMMKLSGRSHPSSPTTCSSDSRSMRTPTTQSGSLHQSNASQDLVDGFDGAISRSMSSSSKLSSAPPTPVAKSSTATSLTTDSQQQELGADGRKAPLGNKSLDARQAVGAIGSAAAAAAKKWGLNVFTRTDQGSRDADRPALDQPMGRGRPLPPPGTPLPPPDDSSLRSKPITLPKRKPVPPPLLPARIQVPESPRPVPRPPLPKRRNLTHAADESPIDDEVLVIQAPAGSEPSSPIRAEAVEPVSNLEYEVSSESIPGSFESSVDLEKKLV
jgi:hypothetical protein